MAIIRVTKISLFIVLLSVLSYGATAQSGCTKILIGLSPCLNYVTGNSSTPSPSCCSQLSNVVKSQPQCLCLLLNGTASSYGINVNQTLALALPGVCGVQTPSASRCNAGNGPTASPADPSTMPETKPSGSDIPSGSKTVPLQNSGHSSTKAPHNVPIFVLFIASLYALSVAGF